MFTITRHLPINAATTALREDVLQGLTAAQKSLPPKWFYDARGSELFEEITHLPEYYPTNAEREILAAHSTEIAAAIAVHTLVELGSGSSEKTRLLLTALRENGNLRRYVPVDVSESALRSAATGLLKNYQNLAIHALVADFQSGFVVPPTDGPMMLAFLGGTIGNFFPDERAHFLASIRDMSQPGDALLLGTDLVKDEQTLVAAYNDVTGVTAAFHKNLLSVLNRELAADFNPEMFEHVALWNAESEWIEMRLRSLRQQTINFPTLGLSVPFARDEELRTEISAKFRKEGIRAELAAAGYTLKYWWTDVAERYALSLSVVG
ncbi:MAG: L-histidine N(alpha)-methyltransferase [Corynebacteriales bacterium]|nr:L-histidine N(alpha)-methyltransferase [Mycobacteriales bacterium]